MDQKACISSVLHFLQGYTQAESWNAKDVCVITKLKVV